MGAEVGRTGSRARTKLPPPTEEEQNIIDAVVASAEQEIDAINRQSEIQEFLLDRAPEFFEGIREAIAEAPTAADATRMFEDAANAAIRAGEADIERFTQLGLEQIRDTLAPSRGLRPEDSPILGFGNEVLREGQFQQGQRVRGVRSAQATSQ